MSQIQSFSLIDLRKQFPFQIDDEIRRQICFSEALVISCGHYEGEPGHVYSESDWTCQSTSSTLSTEVKETVPFEVRDKPIEEETLPEEESDDDDFQFFFFSDCNKITPKDSNDTILFDNGFPKLNPAKKDNICTCKKEKAGDCTCFFKTPCRCGAVETNDCTCKDQENICICDPDDRKPVCTCDVADICLCHPDGKPRAKCTCDTVDKPCICHRDKFPFTVCECPYKPFSRRRTIETIDEIDETMEDDYNEQEQLSIETPEPCDCQVIVKQTCLCVASSECICKENACICGVRNTCVCKKTDSREIPCKGADSQSICSCNKPQDCTCDVGSNGSCTCFPYLKKCTCGDPENCKCHKICDCTMPCTCDLKPKDDPECVCDDPAKQLVKESAISCTCAQKKKEVHKLKKVRAGKHGYRWCHDVDPYHTFFDYAYGRHDKISYGEKPMPKVEILGLHDKQEDGECAVHGIEAPPYEKKVRKPTLDCCSTVGGMSVSIETLGDDANKFLVQVVSHSSKEGAKSGSKLISIVDFNLHTMEENRTEHMARSNKLLERRSYMAICETGYYNKVTCKCDDRTTVKRNYHSFEKAKNFLLEGANVVLLRYLGIARYRGTIKTDTVLINGHVCESIYVSQGVSQAVVNGRPLFVVKVERHIIEPNGNLQQTLSVITLRGYIVSHEWANNSYVIHINPLLRIVPEKDEIEQHAPLRDTWREDLQLFSDYLDFKSERTSEGGRYAQENGVLTTTVRDYLQTLLMLRPADVMNFTRYYFGSTYSALDLPHNDFFEPGEKHVRYFFFED